MNNIQKISFQARSYRNFKLIAISSLVFVSTSCSMMAEKADKFTEFYKENAPIQTKGFSNGEVLAFGTKGFGPIDDFDITSTSGVRNNVGISSNLIDSNSSGGIRIGRSISLPNEEIEKGLAFQASEERRNAQKYLTMR